MSSTDDDKVLIIPCSGIGKAFGSVGREATYVVVDEMRPGETDTLCLSLLTLGDEEAKERVRGHPVITIDGCPKACAEVNVESAGGQSAANFKVVDTYREHRDLKVPSVVNLGEDGRKLSRLLAEKVAAAVDSIKTKE
ncbi:MAG TPA: putative zinc-binding protein [Anaerolineae bacterium]|nr:putative zinc-binding protein [Anaerolineae bacterium]